MVKCKEGSLHHVLNIYKGNILLLITNSEVAMPLNALRHQEVILLTWSINASWAQDDIREGRRQQLFSLQLTLTVGCVRLWSICWLYLFIRLLLSDSAKDTKT